MSHEAIFCNLFFIYISYFISNILKFNRSIIVFFHSVTKNHQYYNLIKLIAPDL
jgi:hypothetical protein